MKRTNNPPSIGVLGLWHLGCVYSTALSELGFITTGFDQDTKIVNGLNKYIPPIFEPDLTTKLKKYLNKNLFFTFTPKAAIADKKYVFITLDIPVNNQDKLNLKPLNKLFALVLQYCSPNTTVVISSQVPLGTSRHLQLSLQKKHKSIKVIYFPENLRLGDAYNNFLKPDRIILGADNLSTVNTLKEHLVNINCPVLSMSLESAEMVKHALNAYLALNISFSSEIGDLCELYNANQNDIVNALKSDKRVSPYAPINPGLGFAGGTLGRDLQTLKILGQQKNYSPKLTHAIYSVNKDRLPFLIKKIQNSLSNIKSKNIGILGLTYKPNTNTLRRSMAVELAKQLNREKAVLKAFDPQIKDPIKKMPYLKVCRTQKEFFSQLDAIVLMTDWPQFKNLKPSIIARLVNKKNIIDTKNMLNLKSFVKHGFKCYPIGYTP